MNLNKVMIIGNLTRDPEIKNTPAGVAVASFSVATSMVWTDQSGQKQEKVEFHNIVAWRRLAEICGQYLRKGSKVYIEGRLQTRNWMGTDNAKHYRTEIVAENMIMLDRAGGQNQPSSGGTANNYSNQPFAAEPTIQIDESTPEATDEEIKVENIPF